MGNIQDLLKSDSVSDKSGVKEVLKVHSVFPVEVQIFV